MGSPLYGLVILACPIGMGLMMWLMMRGRKSGAVETSPADSRDVTELAQLRAEVDRLKAADRSRGTAAPAADAAPGEGARTG